MRHIPDGVLRRLDDEPLAIPDRVNDHLETCERCGARRAEIAQDTERVAQLFSGPQLVPDTDAAWRRIERELDGGGDASTASPPVVVRARRPHLPHVSLRAGLAIGAVSVAVAGTAAAATLTTIFAPTHVAAVPVTQRDMRAIVELAGLGGTHTLGGYATPEGSTTLHFGTVTWFSHAPQPARSAAAAGAQAGFPVTLPSHLPRGVGQLQRLVVEPRVSATVAFNASTGSLAGSSVTVQAGPAVLAEYGAASGAGGPTLAVTVMRRPTAQSTGVTLSRIEAFLLAHPGMPPALAEEIRLLGDLRTTLPVPVPAGATVRSVQIGGWPGVVVADGSNAVAGVVWEDGRGLLHAIVGILSSQDILNVARQVS